MHELHLLPDHVLKRTEESAAYLEWVHEQYRAIDLETFVKNSTLLADIHADMKRRHLPVPPRPTTSAAGEEVAMITEPEPELDNDQTDGNGEDDDNAEDDDTDGNNDNGVHTGDPA